jgi:iron complex transport system substrate-binding protein
MVGCSPVATPAPAPEGQNAAPATGGSATEREAPYPVTIEHKYGSTTLSEFPERIVTVGLTDHDALIALGIVPVGTTEWFNEYPGALWPWASDKLNGAALPTVVGDATAINFEGIATLQPDLILALYAGVSADDYALLSQIAPTIVQPESYVDYGMPWQEIARVVGMAVGKAEEAEALITAIDERFAQIQADHPEFVGATSVVATPYEGIWVYGEPDVRGRRFSRQL